MKLCLASTSSTSFLADILDEARFVLESYWYVKEWQIPFIKNWEFFVLDSGAFTYMNSVKGGLPDPEIFQRKYIKFVKDNNIRYFFNLDLDTLIGIDRTKVLRDELEYEVGRPCIPVFHKCMGLDAWHEMCEAYDYVAIGTIYEYASHKDVLRKLVRIADRNGTRVHGLGYTASDVLDFGFYSVDSSSWLSGGRYGTLYNFKGGKMLQYSAPAGKRTIHHTKMARHNFHQWVLYQNYLDRYE